MVYYGFRATETEPPEDDCEFNAAVIRALEDMRAHGSQTFTIRQLFHVAGWRQTQGGAIRIARILKTINAEQFNKKHYRISRR